MRDDLGLALLPGRSGPSGSVPAGATSSSSVLYRAYPISSKARDGVKTAAPHRPPQNLRRTFQARPENLLPLGAKSLIPPLPTTRPNLQPDGSFYSATRLPDPL